ncbi:cytochrome [Fischerella thermalis]|uniref:cytochrome n=1 Tax=Fischerella thermalis TaxID=372787 RepID=UPI000E09E5EA|nr:cytochrome [Fischerella thermalis]RDH49598.1 cytochrome [Fischerella thermalis 111/344/542]
MAVHYTLREAATRLHPPFMQHRFLLSQHPQVEAKLQQELETVLGDHLPDDGSYFIASCDRPFISPHTTTKQSGCVSPLINTATKLPIIDYQPSQI